MKSRLGWMIAALLVCAARAWAGAGGVVVDTGHQQRVSAMAYGSRDALVFSGSEDGLLIGWDVYRREPEHSIRVSHQAIRALAVHPRLPHVAVVESGLASARLSVWDYANSRRLFARQLETAPSSLTYSSTGKYLVYTRERFDSVIFVDPLDGDRLRLFDDGFGMVSYVAFNGKDTTLMTYRPTGQVDYWDIRSGEQLLTLDSVSYLSNIHLLQPDKSVVVGSSAGRLLVADILGSRGALDFADMDGIVALAVSSTGEIACLSEDADRMVLTRWRYDGDFGLHSLSSDTVAGEDPWSEPPPFSGRPNTVTYAGYRLYIGTDAGEIAWRWSSGQFQMIGANTLLEVSDLAVHRGAVVLGSEDRLLVFVTDFQRSLRVETYANPAEGPVGLAVSPEGSLYVWNQRGKQGELREYAPSLGQYGTVPIHTIPSVLLDVGFEGGELLCLERSGRCTVLGRVAVFSGFDELSFSERSYEERFEYMAPSANVLVRTRDHLVIGKSALRTDDSPLLLIDRRTRETVRVASDDTVVYDLIYDPGLDRLLSLSVRSDRGESFSELKSHAGEGYQSVAVLQRYRGEDATADLWWDEAASVAYTTLGYSEVRAVAGNRTSTFSSTGHLPRKIVLDGNRLFALNSDGTVSLWNTRTRREILTLYVFKDYEWLVVTPSGEYLCSPGGEQYLGESAGKKLRMMP